MRAICGWLAFLRLGNAVLAQGPSNVDPHAVLLSWVDAANAPKAAEQYTLAIDLYAGIEKDVARYEEAVKARNAKQLKLLAVGKTHAANVHLGRVALRLSDWGEPAGHDLLSRSSDLAGRLKAIREAMVVPYAELIKKALPALQARAKKYKRVLAEVEKLIAADKLDAAEQKLLPVYLELIAMAWWYDGKAVYGDLLPYVTVDSKVLDALNKANAKVAAETLVALRDKTTPDFKRLPAALDSAAAALKSSPTADFNGKSLTGPEIFFETIKRWRHLHDDGVRALALNQALVPQHDAGAQIARLSADATAMQAQIISGLTKLIDADASRAQPDEIADLHATYLDLAAKLALISRDQAMFSDVDAALNRLAAKAPSLKADVAAYRGATEDLLRWRNRAADAMAKSYRKSASAMPIARVNEIQSNPVLPTYIAKLADESLKKDVVVSSTFLAAGKDAAASSFSNNTLVRVCTPQLQPLTTLKTDLLVSDSLPPLTIAAAKAIRAAERGAFVECGGTISKVELIGTIPFLATETPFRRSVVSLGEFVPAEISSAAKPQFQVVLVSEITPRWVRGDGFFAVVAP